MKSSSPEKTDDAHKFVEQLWARRKVGYMLDQIRVNGDKPELVSEVVALAKKYGITTPYTSYLIVPDMVLPVARRAPRRRCRRNPLPALPTVVMAPSAASVAASAAARTVPAVLAPTTPTTAPTPVLDYAKANQNKPGDLEKKRDEYADKALGEKTPIKGGAGKDIGQGLADAKSKKESYDQYRSLLQNRDKDGTQVGKLGVDLSLQMQNLRNQTRLEQTAVRQVNGRNCLELGGVWIDEGFDAKMTAVTIKAQSKAYFDILEKQPKMKEVYQLGNHTVWVTPNNTALVIDTSTGKDELSAAEISKLFTAKK